MPADEPNKFRLKIVAAETAMSKVVVTKLRNAASQANVSWLYVDGESSRGDKRATIALFLYEMIQNYQRQMKEDQFEIEVASSRGFYKDRHFLLSQTKQFDLFEMKSIPPEDCILIVDSRTDSVNFKMR